MKNFLRTASAGCAAIALVVGTSAGATVTFLPANLPVADPISQETFDAMQLVCDQKAADNDLDGVGVGDIYSGEVNLGAVTLETGYPTENDSHSITDAIEGTLMGVGYHEASRSFGTLTKSGGSPNLFAEVTAKGVYYDSSTYDFVGNFHSEFDHAFTCDIYKAALIPGQTATGSYEIRPDLVGTSQANAILQECAAYNRRGQRSPLPGYWGSSPHGNCVFVPGEDTPDDWGTPTFVKNVAGGFEAQGQDDDLTAHENDGAGFSVTPDVPLGRMVVCNSPTVTSTGKKGNPGTWKPQNQYDGGDLVGPAEGCNTLYFNVAPWGAGTMYSHTNYWSLPDIVI